MIHAETSAGEGAWARRLGRVRPIGAAAAVGATLLLTGCVSNTVDGGTAVTTGAVNVRSGPGTRFPIVTSVPSGTPLTVYGCLQDGSWCDTSVGDVRGWISSRYLSVYQRPYAPQYPVVTFDFGFWGDSWDSGGGGGFRRNDPL